MNRYSPDTTVSTFFVSQSIQLAKKSINFLLQNESVLVSLLLLSTGSGSSDTRSHPWIVCRDWDGFEDCVKEYCQVDITGACIEACDMKYCTPQM